MKQKTTPYTPQQNGVVERMNRTLLERSRSMLSGAGLEQKFWVEAVMTACYLINRSPSSALGDKWVNVAILFPFALPLVLNKVFLAFESPCRVNVYFIV